jgi:peptide/nickel transport system substrate-binding protein
MSKPRTPDGQLRSARARLSLERVCGIALRPRRARAICAVFIALVASACGGGSTSSKGVPNPDGAFVYALDTNVTSFDPLLSKSSTDEPWLLPAYDRLVHIDPDGKLIPGLAESWTFSDHDKTLTLTLRHGVTFHDGSDFNADVVIANFKRGQQRVGSSVATDLANVEDAVKVNDYMVDLKLKVPDVSVPAALSGRAGMQISAKAIDDGVNLGKTMVGTGPFKLVKLREGDSATFERFDRYWGEKAKVKTLTIKLMLDQVSRLNALRTGEIDATILGSSQVRQVKGDKSIDIQLKTTFSYVSVQQNRSRAKQDDVRVRKAMMYGMDREGICKAVYFGYCEVTAQPFPKDYYAHNDSIDDVLYPYDPAKAKSLLAEAGVESLDVKMITGAGLTDKVAVAQAIQAQWKQIGINATLKQVDVASLADEMYVKKSADDLVSQWGGRPDPAITIGQRGISTGFYNPGGVSTPLLDKLYAKASAEPDPAVREELLQAASKETAESALEMVVLFPQLPYATRSTVSGFTPYITGKPEFRSVTVSD